MIPQRADVDAAAAFEPCDRAVWWRALVGIYRGEAEQADDPTAVGHLREAARILADHLDAEDEAASCLREAHRRAPDALGPLRALVELAERRGAWTEAARWLEALLPYLPSGPERVSVLARLAAVCQDHLQDRGRALECLLEATALAPDDAELILRLELVAPLDDPLARLEVLQRVVPSSLDRAARARLFLEIGEIQEQAQHDDVEALRSYRAALEADPELRPAFEGITRIHVREGRWAELVTTLMHGFGAVEDEQTRGRLLYLCALVNFAKLSTPERARLFLGQAAMLLTDDEAAMREIVADYEQLGMWGPAGALLEDVASRGDAPTAASAWYRIGLGAEVGLGRTDRAVEAWQRALELDPGHLPALAALRRVGWRLDAPYVHGPAAEGLAGRAERPEVEIALRTHLGEVAELRASDRDAAEAHHRAAFAAWRVDPDETPRMLPVALEALLRLRAAAGDWNDVEALARAALERPLQGHAAAAVRDVLARIYERRLDRPEQALRLNEQVLAAYPDNLRAQRARLRLLERTGAVRDLADALEEARTAGVDPPRALALLTRRAEVLEGLGEPDAAEATWRASLTIRPDWLPARMGLGQLLYRHGRWRDLAQLYREELDHVEDDDPARAGLLGRLAELEEFRLERPEAAAQAYEALLAIKPRAPDALAGLERLYGSLGRWADLARVLRLRAEEIEAARDRATIMFRLGEVLHEHLREDDEALDAYEVALTLWPDLLPAGWALERLIVQRGERDRLAMLYRSLLPRLQSSTQRAVMAHKLAGLLPPAEAHALLEDVVAGDAPDAHAHWALAREAAEIGDRGGLARQLARLAQCANERRDAVALWREAAESAEDALLSVPERVALWERLAPLIPESGRPREALLALRARGPLAERAALLTQIGRGAEDERVRSVALWWAGLLEAREGRADAAINLWSEARAACEDDPMPLWLMLERSADDGPDVQAGLLEAAARRGRDGARAAADLTRAGALYAEVLDDPDRALSAYVEAVRRDPTAEEASTAAATLLEQRGGFEELAALMQRRARRLEAPEVLGPLLRDLARLQLEGLGDRAAAITTFEQLVELMPEDYAARIELANLHYALDAFEPAAEHYAAATRLADDEAALVDTYTRLGQIKARHLGDLQGAIDDLRRAVGLLDPEGRALEELAGVYLHAEEADLALLAYQRLEKLADTDARRSAARAGQVRALLVGGRRDEAVERLRAFREADSVDPMLAALARDLGDNSGDALAAEPTQPMQESGGAPLAAVQLRRVRVTETQDVQAALAEVSEALAADPDAEDDAPTEADRALGALGLMDTTGAMQAVDITMMQAALPPPLPVEPVDEQDALDVQVAHTLPIELPVRPLAQDAAAAAPPPASEAPPPVSEAPPPVSEAPPPVSEAPPPAPETGVSRQTMPYGTVSGVRPAPPPLPRSPREERPEASGRTSTGMPVMLPTDRTDSGISRLGPLPGTEDAEIAAATDAERLADEARLALHDDPLDIEAWAQLQRAVGLGRSTAAAVWLRGVVAWVEGEVRPSPPIDPPGPLPERLRSPLVPPSVPTNVLRLLRDTRRAVLPAFGGRSGRAGSSELALDATDPVSQVRDRIAGGLGSPPHVLVRSSGKPYTVTLEGGEPPRLVLGGAILDAARAGTDPSALSFLLAYGLVPLQEGTLAARNLSDREFRAYLGTLIDVLGTEFPMRARDRATAERIRGWLEPALASPPPAWGPLARAAATGLGNQPATAVRAGMELYAGRLSLALSDGFGGAFEMLRMLDFDDRPRSALERFDVEQFLADSDGARDLLVFAGSAECLEIRAWLAGEAG